MNWVRFLLATAAIWLVGAFVLFGYAMMECFPNTDQCIADKRQGAALIFLIITGLWIGSAFLIFRKRPAD